MWTIAFYTINVMVVIYTIHITTMHDTCDALSFSNTRQKNTISMFDLDL